MGTIADLHAYGSDRSEQGSPAQAHYSAHCQTCALRELCLNLRMTREESGSYLGLTLETISRAFSRFQGDGVLEVQHKSKEIKLPDRLRAVMR